MRKVLYPLIILLVLMGCSVENPTRIDDVEVITAWADMTTYVMQYTPANSPTFASRSVGYIGLTMYETIVNGFNSHQSVANQLNDPPNIPKPEPDKQYDWIISLNAGQATILKNIYNQTSDLNKNRIDSLELTIENYYSNLLNDSEVVDRSKKYGQAVAQAIFEWSKSDGGHRGYLKNFDKELVHPDKPGSWKPPLYAQSFSHHPLHPHWGKNRTFIRNNSNLELPVMIAYDTAKNSPYYQEFLAVYEKDKELTQEEKEIAIWWGDDPDDSFTPPGHSYYLTTLAIKKLRPDVITCSEAYAKVGMAVADAFINCWKWKYHFFSERPNTYIPKNIDKDWESFWPDPPFPAFPSGHAIQAAASTTILADVFGDKLTFIDSAHVGRPRDELRNTDFKARSFESFWDVALETADSRFYGGIHTPQDNKIGLEEGSRIARHVIQLDWAEQN